MIETLLYGFTIGAILYFFSIGLSITFGTMQIVNFAHGMVYALGVYFFITFLPIVGRIFPLALVLAILVSLPIAYVVERFVIRRLYGESLDYAIIATYAVLLMGTDAIKWIWGAAPQPVSDPVGLGVRILDINFPLYRIFIVISALALFGGLRFFFRRSIVGKIVAAALEDREGVRCLGLNVNKYFSIVFVIGSGLAVLGGVLYAPIATSEPYMGFHILLVAFAVVIVGGNGQPHRDVCCGICFGDGHRHHRAFLVHGRGHDGFRGHGFGLAEGFLSEILAAADGNGGPGIKIGWDRIHQAFAGIFYIRRFCKILESKKNSPFRASGARPDSSPAWSWIQRVLDSGFRRNDGVFEFCKRLPGNGIL